MSKNIRPSLSPGWFEGLDRTPHTLLLADRSLTGLQLAVIQLLDYYIARNSICKLRIFSFAREEYRIQISQACCFGEFLFLKALSESERNSLHCTVDLDIYADGVSPLIETPHSST